MSADQDSEAPVVPGYAGHGDTAARHLSDQQVRAWVGELLTDLQDRLPVDGHREQLDALLLRCEFADQHVVHAIEDERFAADAFAAAIELHDRKLVAAAAACATVDAAGLGALFDGLKRAFDERAQAIEERLKRSG